MMVEVEDDLISNCCNSTIYMNTDVCVECGEHCEPIEYCEGEDNE